MPIGLRDPLPVVPILHPSLGLASRRPSPMEVRGIESSRSWTIQPFASRITGIVAGTALRFASRSCRNLSNLWNTLTIPHEVATVGRMLNLSVENYISSASPSERHGGKKE